MHLIAVGAAVSFLIFHELVIYVIAIVSCAWPPHDINTTTHKNTLASLYLQASKEEKKAFRLWLLEQDMK